MPHFWHVFGARFSRSFVARVLARFWSMFIAPFGAFFCHGLANFWLAFDAFLLAFLARYFLALDFCGFEPCVFGAHFLRAFWLPFLGAFWRVFSCGFSARL